MKVNRETFIWKTNKDWYYFNKELDRYEIKEDAPPEAKESFEKWKKYHNFDY